MGQERQCLWVGQRFRSLENTGKHSLLIFRGVVVSHPFSFWEVHASLVLCVYMFGTLFHNS